MKNQVKMLVMGLVFACFSLQAQAPEHLAARMDQLRKMSDQVQAMPQKLVAAERGGILRLDSTVTFVNFFAGDSLANEKSTFEYPGPNHEIITDYLKFDDWAKTERTTKVLDDQGRLTVAFGDIWDEDQQEWIPNSWLRAFPHEDSPVLNDSFFIFIWDGNLQSWVENLSVKNKYDAQDRLVVVETSFQFEPFGLILLRDEHVYDANGNNTLTNNFIHDGDAWVPYGMQEAFFDNNLEIERISYVYIDDINLEAQSRWTKGYDSAGNVTLAESWELDPETNDWKLLDLTITTYDAANRMTNLEFHAYDESFPVHQLIRFGYENDTDLKVETLYVLNEAFNEWALESKTYYYYTTTTSAPSIPVVAERIQVFPNPTTGLVNLNVGPDAIVSVMDARGAVVNADVQTSARSMNLGHLPAGIYYVRVLENEQYKLATVVKQ